MMKLDGPGQLRLSDEKEQRACMPIIYLDLRKGKQPLFLPTMPCGTNRDELRHEKPTSLCKIHASKMIDLSGLTVIS